MKFLEFSSFNKLIISCHVADHNIDLLAVTKTWITSDAPPAVKADIVPYGYAVLHVLRESEQGGPKHGGGLTVIHRDSLVVRNYALQEQSKPITFELQLVNIRTSLIVANIYRPTNQFVNAVFFDEIADLLTNILATTSKSLLLTGDFNYPGKASNTIDARVTAVLEEFGMVQMVSCPTCGNNLPDILTHNEEESVVHYVRLDDAGCVSDHQMVLAQLELGWRRLKPVTFSFRRLKQLNFDLFEKSTQSTQFIFVYEPSDKCKWFRESTG